MTTTILSIILIIYLTGCVTSFFKILGYDKEAKTLEDLDILLIFTLVSWAAFFLAVVFHIRNYSLKQALKNFFCFQVDLIEIITRRNRNILEKSNETIIL